jgi:hypothetical protein
MNAISSRPLRSSIEVIIWSEVRRRWLSAATVPRQAGDRHRDGYRYRRGLDEVIRRDETKPDRLLGALNRERWLAASWASIEVGRDGGVKRSRQLGQQP